MAMTKNEITDLLRINFPDAKIELIDLAGDNDHWSLTIQDETFKGIPKIKQHKLVNESLKSVLGGKLHALSIKTISC